MRLLSDWPRPLLPREDPHVPVPKRYLQGLQSSEIYLIMKIMNGCGNHHPGIYKVLEVAKNCKFQIFFLQKKHRDGHDIIGSCSIFYLEIRFPKTSSLGEDHCQAPRADRCTSVTSVGPAAGLGCDLSCWEERRKSWHLLLDHSMGPKKSWERSKLMLKSILEKKLEISHEK